MDLVYRHKSGGTLWQGGIKDVDDLERNHNPEIHVIGLFAQEVPVPSLRNYEVLEHGFDDNRWMREPEAQELAKLVDEVSDKVASRVRSGKGVLSSCHMGLNRSGLVSALTLMKLVNLEPDEAIGLVRVARGSDALHNNVFVDIIRWMKHKKGAISAWTEWQCVGDDLLSRSAMVEMTTEEIRRVIKEIGRRGLGGPATPDQ